MSDTIERHRATLTAVLDFLTVDPCITNAMRRIDYTPKTFWTWVKQSRENPSAEKWLVRWPDETGEPILFADAVVLARRIQLANWESRLRSEVDQGVPRILRDGAGNVVYEIDHKLLADFEGNADDARALGYHDPFYVHDENGARKPVVVFDKPAAALQVHAARALLANAGYNPSNISETDNRVTGKVLVMSATRQGDATPPPYARPDEGGVSELKQDLMRRLADLRERGPVNPQPRAMVRTDKDRSDDPPERTGK